MCFDVPKAVRSPGYDQGHDEESRNGRDVKINILDDYIRTSERFRVIQIFSEYRRVTGINREGQWAFVGFSGNRGQQGSVGCDPLGPNRIGLGLWGPAPSFLLPFSSFLPLLVGLGKGGTYS